MPEHAQHEAWEQFASIGENVQIDPTVRVFGADRIHIGSNVRIDAFAILSAGAEGITIGDYAHIACYVFLSGASRITVGEFVGLSGRVLVYSSNGDYSGEMLANPTNPVDLRNDYTAPVTFEAHSLIGAGGVVLPGVTVGQGAAAGAMSLLRDDVDPFTIVAGVPAKPIGTRSRGLLEQERILRARTGSSIQPDDLR